MPITSPRASEIAYPAPTLYYGDKEEWLHLIAAAVQGLMRGKMNAVKTVTLTASAASTTVTDARIGRNTVLVPIPTTANAAAEWGAGTLYQTHPNATADQAVLNHANNAQTDRTFAVLMIG